MLLANLSLTAKASISAAGGHQGASRADAQCSHGAIVLT